MKKAVFGLVSSEEQAEHLVHRLLSIGFSEVDISLLTPDKNSSLGTKIGTLTTEKHSKAPEGGATGAATGGFVGGSLGLLVGLGTFTLPGLGPLLAAGPMLAALSVSAIGGSLGLLIGSLIGWGIPEYEARKLEAGVKGGKILVSVHGENEDELNAAYETMKREGAKDIATSWERHQAAI